MRENRHAAEYALDGKAQIFAIITELIGNLRGKFAGRREHQHPAAIGFARFDVGGKTVQRWQRKGCGFTRAGLRNTAQIAALQQRWDRLHLDGGGGIISRFGKRLQDGLGKAQFFKK